MPLNMLAPGEGGGINKVVAIIARWQILTQERASFNAEFHELDAR
jgi:hypothetical protein